jgi:hypothetical protein
MTAGLLVVGTANAGAASAVQAEAATTGSSGSATVGSASYAIPAGALYVSPSGSDTAAGTSAAPLKTVTKAISKATSGKTLVLRAGTYHENVVVNKTVTIQNYPGEAVWFDGSSAVSNFVASGATWRLDGWKAEFDASPTYTTGAPPSTAAHWGFVNAAFPMASHPDQVWIDGTAQLQASSLAGVKAGWFYVDYAANRLYLGSNPAGKSVRASDIAQGVNIRAAGAVLRGVGVRRFAPSIPMMGTVTVSSSGVSIENVYISDNSTTGLSVMSSNAKINAVTSTRNGMLGVHANNADNVSFSNVRSVGNNTEKFNQAPVSGGIKITRTRGVTIKNSSFEDNTGTGIWMDESVYDVKIVSVTSRRNTGHGMSLEISAKILVANSLVTDNGGSGLKINDSSNVRVWNNTLIDNGRQVSVAQDDRRASNLSLPGHDKRQKLPDPTVTWISGPVEVRNNVISGSHDKCLLCVEDFSHVWSAEQMKVTALGNVYQRDTTTKPSAVAIWSNGAGNPSVYKTLAAFKTDTGQEAKSLMLEGPAAAGSDGHVTAAVTAQNAALAQPLPADIATLASKTAGTKQLGVIW